MSANTKLSADPTIASPGKRPRVDGIGPDDADHLSDAGFAGDGPAISDDRTGNDFFLDRAPKLPRINKLHAASEPQNITFGDDDCTRVNIPPFSFTQAAAFNGGTDAQTIPSEASSDPKPATHETADAGRFFKKSIAVTPTNQIVKSVEAAKSTIEAVTESAPKGALKSVAPIASKPPMPLRTDKTMRPPVAHTPLSIEPLPKDCVPSDTPDCDNLSMKQSSPALCADSPNSKPSLEVSLSATGGCTAPAALPVLREPSDCEKQECLKWLQEGRSKALEQDQDEAKQAETIENTLLAQIESMLSRAKLLRQKEIEFAVQLCQVRMQCLLSSFQELDYLEHQR
ncbi:Uncharacterized protein PBTT_06992 [Plasmodiophora brassicae]|uniref:Uncharacterized protein n=1 Tax=Plasmodiophora brassicae TaxID=37360 RepID=A0A0G4J854_PLABS|nr:hypothetical protein PBRA_003400 [Plasmodiophora brassicae]SPQ99750.1 unnamed protein product [Plasmodiophora brassicae]